MKRHAAPIIAAVLLLLPVLYVGSYLALVIPNGRMEATTTGASTYQVRLVHYRTEGLWARRLYWPLEQIDRKLRPGAWEWKPIVPPKGWNPFIPESGPVGP